MNPSQRKGSRTLFIHPASYTLLCGCWLGRSCRLSQMPSTDSTSKRAQSRRVAQRSRYAQRTCLNCRKSKTRCQLYDLTTPSSPSPLTHDKAFHRCVSPELHCIVDDSQRRTTKAGTARYVLDGLLQRTNASSSSASSPSLSLRHRPYAYDSPSTSSSTPRVSRLSSRETATRRQNPRNDPIPSSRSTYTTRMFVSRPPSSIARPCQKSGSIHSTFFGIGRDAGINTDHESQHGPKTSSLTTSTANRPARKPELRSLPASFAATAWAASSAAAPCSRSPGSDSSPY